MLLDFSFASKGMISSNKLDNFPISSRALPAAWLLQAALSNQRRRNGATTPKGTSYSKSISLLHELVTLLALALSAQLLAQP